MGRWLGRRWGLSNDWVFRYLGEWGHDLPIRRPAMVVDEVRGLLERMGEERDGEGKVHIDVGDESGSGRRREVKSDGKVKDKRTVRLSAAMSFLG